MITTRAVYTAEVVIDDTTFNLLVDTGSSDTWVASLNTTCFDPFAEAACTFPTHLSVPEDEKSLEPFYTSYVDKSNVTGGLIQRPLSIAGIAIQDQVIGLVDEAFLGRTDGSLDGLLGLGLGAVGTSSYLSIFGSMIADKLIERNSFSIALLGTADMDERDSGLLAFGGIPESIKLTSEWGIAPILTDAFYAIEVDGFMFPGSARDHALAGSENCGYGQWDVRNTSSSPSC
ncbi:uncharacterized protein A1O5_09360 [Cladophialophora psammophila CBS 110553]|uniref:Peptidase A1 domain-containing protein n=1 Tax=Cladophialophora psammophila CBS 110553 TaxID=1182543 RepID=W9WGW7_9EURO|nr:uncharacterized protein A1O5_09360 [Cladophialophora psammophila CBS 110553]EXJ67347.1 hypothetical protein A1O5_09360 [Cladophialophora psammophila CBS 110553]